MQCAVVPTLSGEAVLTPFHPYGAVRHLHNKPVKAFTDRDQFLLVAAAEKEGLLKVHFKVDPAPGLTATQHCTVFLTFAYVRTFTLYALAVRIILQPSSSVITTGQEP